MPIIWAGLAIAGLFAASELAEDSAVLVDKTASLTGQAAKAGLVAGGVYALYLAHKKGVI